MNVLRVGLIGLGEVAQSIHLPALNDLHGLFRIAGLYDVSPSLLRYCSARYPSAEAFPSAEALIESPNIEAVFILSPDETHSRYAAAAMRADKHILLEKPPCLTLREIDALLEQQKHHRKLLFVAYMRRYAPGFLAAKEALPAHADVTHVRVYDLISGGRHFLRQSQEVFYPGDIDADVIARGRAAREALLREVTGAGAPADLVRAYHSLAGLSSHNLSAMRELIGNPLRVVGAHRSNDGANTTAIFDYGHFTATYDAMVDDIGLFDAMIEIRSNRRRVRIVYDTPYIRNLPTHLDITENDGSAVSTRRLGPFYEDAFTTELKVFHKHISDGTMPKTSLADARDDLNLWIDIVDKMKLS